jgi:hypothetical protein
LCEDPCSYLLRASLSYTPPPALKPGRSLPDFLTGPVGAFRRYAEELVPSVELRVFPLGGRLDALSMLEASERKKTGQPKSQEQGWRSEWKR